MRTPSRTQDFRANKPRASFCIAQFVPLSSPVPFPSSLVHLNVLLLSQIWVLWNKAVFLPPNTFFVRTDKITKLSTSQTCKISVAFTLPLLLLLHLGSSTWLFLCFLFSAKFILFPHPLKPKPMNCLSPLYFPSIHPSLPPSF